MTEFIDRETDALAGAPPPSARARPETPILDAQARLAVQAAGLGLWEWDVPAGLFQIDARFAEILGRPHLVDAPFAAERVAEMTHPDDRHRVETELAKTLQHAEYVFSTVHRAIRPDGDTVWLRARAAVIARDTDGAPLRVAGVAEDCTEQQIDALARAAEKRRNDLVIKASAAGVWEWEVASGAVFWNDHLRDILGVRRDAPLRFETLTDHIHCDDRIRFEAELAAHLRTGEPLGLQLRMRRADGEVITVRARAQAEHDGDGEPLRMAGSIVDISKETQARRAISAAEARAGLAIQAAGLVLVEQDLTTGTVDVGDELADLLGRPELAGTRAQSQSVWSHIHPDDHEAVRAVFEEFAAERRTEAATEFRIVRADGEERWLLVHTVRPKEDDQGEARIISVVADLTDRKNAEIALEREKQRYDLAMAGAQMAVWEWRPASRQVTWSRGFNEIIGLPHDYPGETIEDFNTRVPPHDVEAMQDAARKTLTTGEPYECEIHVRHVVTGAWIRVRSRASASLDADGRVTHIAGTLADVSALHAAKEQAELESRRVALALRAGGMGQFDFDFKAEVMHPSARVGEIIGESLEPGQTVSLQHLLDIVHPEDRDATMARLETARTSGADFISEHRIIRPDGCVAWTLTLAAPTAFFPDGEVAAYTGVIQDLTERKEAELALAQANDRFERAVEGALIAIWDWDLETDRVHWSRRLYELLGLDEAERVESIKDVAKLIHPDDLERLRQVQAAHFDRHETFELEYRMLRKDGGLVRVLARGAAARDDTGKPVRFVGSVMDVTAEREAEEAAKLAGARAQYALEAADLGVWQYDAESEAVTMDARLAQLLGRPELADTALEEATIRAFTAPEDADSVFAQLRALALGELEVVRSEHRVVRPDGTRVWILAHVGAPERDASGRPKRLIGITQDLSGQKAVETALREAKERAEAANEAKSTFLATMSHEIRTPLNGVLGMAQLLTLGALDDKQRRYAETILSSGRALSAIIDDVLDISRIEAGRLTLNPQPTLIADLIQASISSSHAAAQSKGLSLSAQVADGLNAARLLDATRMAQVLGNLVSNAVKFTETGAVEVRVAEPRRGWLRFEVDDDGPGIADALHEQIFDRFVQADMSTQRAHGGSGLGLAIARELIELAGGEIGVDSAPGDGALFWFEIPAPLALIEPTGQAPADDAQLAASLVGLRVLVVEDHDINRQAMVELLEHSGCQVEAVSDAGTALERLRASPYDAALLDLHMPGDGGDVVLSAIRAGRAGRSDLPVFFVSADATPNAREQAGRLGANGYFSKPIDAALIREALVGAAAQKV